MSSENSYSSIFTHGNFSEYGKNTEHYDRSIISKAKAVNSFPKWAINAVLYEVNLRQFTPEGTILAFVEELPRIKALGADIIWLMPVHPIGQLRRKGTLGSPYAVSNYTEIHPDLGTIADFQLLLERAHNLDLKVIIDWVANHTAWDHPWIHTHPEYYRKVDGKITDPINPEKNEPWGWEDVAELDYQHAGMRDAMITALLFWVRDMGVNGFRFDVAHQVPTSFWEEASEVLYQEKTLFLLAESEMPEHLNSGSFIANYAWEYMHLMNEYAKGKAQLDQIATYFQKDEQRSKRGFHIYFTTNHDENAWAGTVFERLGEGHLAFAVLACTIDGMPLIYGGQEAPLKKRLRFYEWDPIDWGTYQYTKFYQRLFALKHRNKALWNGSFGGRLQRLQTEADDRLLAFYREKQGDQILVFVNLSPQPLTVEITSSAIPGVYLDIFKGKEIHVQDHHRVLLSAWEYQVLERINTP